MYAPRNRRPHESRERTMVVMIVSVAFYSCLLVHVKEYTSICSSYRQDTQKTLEMELSTCTYGERKHSSK